MTDQLQSKGFSRRGFLGFAGAAAALPLLAACSGGGGASGGKGGIIKFWNMPWASPAFNVKDKQITLAYKPPKGLGAATYQIVQWATFTQTFGSAIASNTGPAVSSGGGLQAFQYAAQGKIAYADNLIATFKKDGTYDDFVDGAWDAMKTDKGYAAVPYAYDMRVMYYRKSLIEKNNITLPTTWDEWLAVAKDLKKVGMYAYGVGGGAGNNVGVQSLISLMINNGGGVFDADKKFNPVTDKNIEAMDFVRELISAGAVDPSSVTYTPDNVYAQWKANKFVIGFWSPGLSVNTGLSDIEVMPPLKSRSGESGALYFPNNLMMYKETPSQEGSEAFLSYYVKNMHQLWDSQVFSSVPVLKSIVNSEPFKKNKDGLGAAKYYLPVAKTLASPGGQAVFPAIATMDGTAPSLAFGQVMLAGKTDSKKALQDWKTAVESA